MKKQFSLSGVVGSVVILTSRTASTLQTKDNKTHSKSLASLAFLQKYYTRALKSSFMIAYQEVSFAIMKYCLLIPNENLPIRSLSPTDECLAELTSLLAPA